MNVDLIIKNARCERGGRIIIDAGEGHFQKGQRVALIGNNGVGKSTLLCALSGVLPLSAGSITLNQQNLCSMPLKIRAQSITFLQQISPQQPYCLAQQRIAHGFLPESGFQWLNDEQIQRIQNLAMRLNIRHLLERTLGTLSGGEQRLIDIAKVLINEQASLVLLDEPSVFLDFHQKRLLEELIIERSHQSIVIFSSHDLDFIEKTATVIVHLSKHTVQQMSPRQFISSFKTLSSNDVMAA